MKYLILLTILCLIACEQKKTKAPENTPTVINDTIPETRRTVSKAPVTVYSEKVKDPLNDWKFAVELFETPATFKFLMAIEYEATNVTDTITIPNFGILPKLEIQQGEEPLSCIVGFYDKKGQFMPYKQVSVQGKQLKIATVQHYARTRFRTK
jgi:hypothetical protein